MHIIWYDKARGFAWRCMCQSTKKWCGTNSLDFLFLFPSSLLGRWRRWRWGELAMTLTTLFSGLSGFHSRVHSFPSHILRAACQNILFFVGRRRGRRISWCGLSTSAHLLETHLICQLVYYRWSKSCKYLPWGGYLSVKKKREVEDWFYSFFFAVRLASLLTSAAHKHYTYW